MSAASIKATLLTKLQNLSHIAVVSGYNAAPWTEYPGAALTINRGDGEFAGTHHNTRTRLYDFTVFVEASKWSPEEVESLSVGILDEVEVALDADTTLSGTVAMVQPTQWDTRYEVREFDMRVLNIQIEVQEILRVRV